MNREDMRRRGVELGRKLGQPVDVNNEVVPGIADFMAEVVYAGIWDRPHLPLADRFVCTPPYTEAHLKLAVGDSVATSVGLLIRRPH